MRVIEPHHPPAAATLKLIHQGIDFRKGEDEWRTLAAVEN